MPSSAPSISPAVAPANLPGHDLDQRMRIYKGEKVGSNESSVTRMISVRPWIPPAIDTSATYYAKGPSANVAARTERWRTGIVPEYPTPPNSNSPIEYPIPPTLGHSRDGLPSSSGIMQHSRPSPRQNSANPMRQQSHSRSGALEGTIYMADSRSQRLVSSPPFSPPLTEDYPIKRSPPQSRGHPRKFPTRVDSVNTQFSVGMNRTYSKQRQNSVDSWIAAVSPPEEAEEIRPKKSYASSTISKKEPEKKKTNLLENVLGIYPAENKLPPGRSAADVLASRLAKKLHLGKKNSPPFLRATPSTQDLNSENNQPTTKHSSAPTRGISVRNDTLAGSFFSPSLHPNYPCGSDGRLLAELPGSMPGECENSPATVQSNGLSPTVAEEDFYSQDDRSVSEQSASGPRPKSRRGRRRFGDRSPKPTNERVYAKMPLPSIPPIPGSSPEPPPETVPRARQRAGSAFGSWRARSSISPKDIADWAECLMKTTAPLVPPLPRSVSMPTSPTITVDESRQVPDGVIRSTGFPPQHSSSSSHSRKSSLSRSSTNSTAPSSSLRSPSDCGTRESSASSVAFDACLGLGTIGEDTSPLRTSASVLPLALHSPELPLHSPELPLHSPASELHPQKPASPHSSPFIDQPGDDDVQPPPTLKQRFEILLNDLEDDDDNDDSLEREEEESQLPDTLDEILDAVEIKDSGEYSDGDVGSYTSFFDDYYYTSKSEEEKEKEELQCAIDEMLSQEPVKAERRPSEVLVAEYDTTTLNTYLKGRYKTPSETTG